MDKFNKNPLCSTGNSTQHSEITNMGKEPKRWYVYVNWIHLLYSRNYYNTVNYLKTPIKVNQISSQKIIKQIGWLVAKRDKD